MKKTLIASVFLATTLVSGGVFAQHRERERFGTPHWVYDSRFHHNHYYPALGYSLAVLPPGNIALTFRTGRFFFHSGVWYQPGPGGYVVVRPPVGIVVPVLPPSYTTVWAAGTPYYYANDVYYVQTPGGYTVAAPPTVAEDSAPPPPASQPPVAAAPPPSGPPSNSWYYCESSRAYYPYVNECKEGWRQVPATPPR